MNDKEERAEIARIEATPMKNRTSRDHRIYGYSKYGSATTIGEDRRPHPGQHSPLIGKN